MLASLRNRIKILVFINNFNYLSVPWTHIDVKKFLNFLNFFSNLFRKDIEIEKQGFNASQDIGSNCSTKGCLKSFENQKMFIKESIEKGFCCESAYNYIRGQEEMSILLAYIIVVRWSER